jgi:hypothetical protein
VSETIKSSSGKTKKKKKKTKQKPKEQIHVLILNSNEQGFFPFKMKLIVSFHDEYLKSIPLTVYTKSMLACLLKNLNNVKLYILLDASTLNLDHKMNTINFI